MSTKRTNKKMLAARVLCTLLLGTYLAGGYQPPVRAAALNVYGNTNITVDSGSFASAWGYGSEDFKVIATGFASTAFGWGTKAEALASTAWGQITSAYGGGSTAFGWNTKAMGTTSTAFGNSSEAGGYAATAFGISSKARSDYSTAFGQYTVAAGLASTAFGESTKAGQLLYGSDNTEAIIIRYYDSGIYKYKIVDANDTSKTLKDGFDSYDKAYDDSNLTTAGDYATAFGYKTKASGGAATAFGDTTEARGENATAWGLKAKAYGVNSTSLGYNTVAGGDGATAFGGGAMALGFYSTAWGYYTQAGQLLYGSDNTVAYIVDYTEGGTTKYKIVDYNYPETTLKGGFSSYWEAYKECNVKDAVQATAWGAGTKALAGNATAFGNGSIASGIRSTAFGWFTEASGEGSTTWGIDSVASGNGATAWGGYTAGMNQVKGGTASGDASTAFGVETIANTKGSTAWGDQTLAGKATIDGTEYSGTYATAFGYGTKASGTYATAFGSLTTASGPVATAWGVGTKASGNRSTAFGDNTTARGFAATAWGTFAIASGDYSTAFGYGTQAGQLLYGAENTEATIERYTKDGETKYRIVNASDWSDILDNNGGTGFASYKEAYNDPDLTKTGAQATAWGYQTKAINDFSTAFGYTTIAAAPYSTAFGVSSQAYGNVSTAWGYNSKAHAQFSTAFNGATTGVEGDMTKGQYATAWGPGSAASGDYSTALGHSSKAIAENSLAALGGTVETAATNSAAIGNGASVTVADTVALGSGSVASREAGATDAYLKTDSDTGNEWISTHNAIAVGNDDTVTRQITGVAAGSKDTDAVNVAQLKKVAEGKLDKAVYEADKADTKAALAGKANVALDNIKEDGKTVIKDLAKGAVNVVGDGPVSVAKSDVSGVDTYTVSVKTDGKVESGDEGIMTGGKVFTETRVSADGNYIKSADSAAKNLEALDTAVGTTADGNYVKASDSVGENLGALDAELAALTAGTGTGLAEVSHRIDNMDSKVEKVGAGAAALAALHPMDTDGKFSMAAGFGNYRSANAMALGVFYRPTDQVMFSMGGSMGNGENLLNVGVSFALDKGVNTSKAAMARKINALEEQNSAILEENKAIRAENAKLAERLAAIEAKLGK